MNELCGMNCCERCPKLGTACAGCAVTNGHPCNGSCVVAECVHRGGVTAPEVLRQALINEINLQHIPGLQLSELTLLSGDHASLLSPVNERTPGRLLDSRRIYWGAQVELPESGRCYGIIADDRVIVVAEYGAYGAEPELVLYKRRK